jgi:hypothetical protein
LQHNTTTKEAARELGKGSVGAGKIDNITLQYYSAWHGATSVSVPATLNLSTGGYNIDSPWGTPDANTVAGYAGDFFPVGFGHGAELKDELLLWMPSLGRSFTMTSKGTASSAGSKRLKFEIDPKEFASGSSPQGVRNREWYNSYNTTAGFLNTSALVFGVPSFVSKPHFLDCDPAVYECKGCVKFTKGFRKFDRELDDTFIEIDPGTGVNM